MRNDVFQLIGCVTEEQWATSEATKSENDMGGDESLSEVLRRVSCKISCGMGEHDGNIVTIQAIVARTVLLHTCEKGDEAFTLYLYVTFK